MTSLETEIKKRRTFGIISHPDAGKTTLTEKLLLFGGAIHVAGAIKAKKASRHATSDFMEYCLWRDDPMHGRPGDRASAALVGDGISALPVERNSPLAT